jgi:hypothetical protein
MEMRRLPAEIRVRDRHRAMKFRSWVIARNLRTLWCPGLISSFRLPRPLSNAQALSLLLLLQRFDLAEVQVDQYIAEIAQELRQI